MPTNPEQVASGRRHIATIGVTVPTKPAKPIRILDDGNIGRIADAQQAGLPGLGGVAGTVTEKHMVALGRRCRFSACPT